MRERCRKEGRKWRRGRKVPLGFVFKNTHHLPSGPHWTEKPEYHPSYATQLKQLRPPCRRITRNIFTWGDHPRGRASENHWQLSVRTGGRFSVLFGAVGELRLSNKKLWVLKVWTWVQGLKFWVKGWCSWVRELQLHAGSPHWDPSPQAPGSDRRGSFCFWALKWVLP